jgi:hypothetical protein
METKFHHLFLSVRYILITHIKDSHLLHNSLNLVYSPVAFHGLCGCGLNAIDLYLKGIQFKSLSDYQVL